MVIGLEYYDQKIAEESLQELKSFLTIANKTMGYYPTIIGGWAVYYHTRDIKSQDIDAVMYDEETYYKFLENDYFIKRGYREFDKGGDNQHFGKETRDSSGKPTTIRMDLMYGNKSQYIKKLDIEKDWRLILSYQEHVTFEGCEMYIPIPEFLITLKIIAALERDLDLRYEEDLGLQAHFRSKIKKDYLDIASLIKKCQLKPKVLKELLQKTKVDKHMETFLEKYKNSDYADIFSRVDLSFDDIKKALSV